MSAAYNLGKIEFGGAALCSAVEREDALVSAIIDRQVLDSPDLLYKAKTIHARRTAAPWRRDHKANDYILGKRQRQRRKRSLSWRGSKQFGLLVDPATYAVLQTHVSPKAANPSVQ